ncbi:putative wd repeat protein [Erysiphe neolycopersici]|uniref:Putative wd repeat protein n=1 Tax=Erysiphe neolycopersici TaxID=212602 RepID=A0A420HCK7_9PEZI|nr:putative wd repeat protein [Erysiphe neolycopersici]
MPYFTTAQEWLSQSALLIEARPTTTRITTKYTIPNPSSKSRTKRKEKHKSIKEDGNTSVSEIKKTAEMTDASALPLPPPPPPPPATLTLKTYDPASGVTLKYKTCKAAEVGRLVQIMGRLGKGMAGLEMNEDVPMTTEPQEKKITTVEMPSAGKKSKGKKKNRK